MDHGRRLNNLTHKVLARLYRGGEEAFSRNKNYESYRDPKVQRAARLYKLLKSLESDLIEHGAPETISVEEAAEQGGGGVRIRVQIEALECRRTAYLTPFEFELLCENPTILALFEAEPPRAAG